MAKRLAASFVTLVHEATLRSYWRRKSLWRFLRQAGIADGSLATWAPEESKRDFLDRLFSRLPDQAKGQETIISLARDLAQQIPRAVLEVEPAFATFTYLDHLETILNAVASWHRP